MPLYDYRCVAGHKYEVRLPFGSPSEQPCEKCGKPAQRQLHARPIMFKGSGWYSTDSRGSSSRSRSSFVSDNDGGEGAKSTKSTSESSTTKSADTSSSTASDD